MQSQKLKHALLFAVTMVIWKQILTLLCILDYLINQTKNVCVFFLLFFFSLIYFSLIINFAFVYYLLLY